CDGITVAKEKTKPLPLYTEAELLKDLRRVAKYVKDPRIKQLLIDRDQGKKGENGGIGTPATRGAVLAKLQERGFYAVEKKKLIPTALGLEFIAALPAIATTPDMTALWHEQQQMIEAGELTVDAFLDELESFIADQVQNIDLGNVQGDGKPILGL
ncbi:DNA topoisomerase, partial [Pseudomonas syringae pv. actinidiae]